MRYVNLLVTLTLTLTRDADAPRRINNWVSLVQVSSVQFVRCEPPLTR